MSAHHTMPTSARRFRYRHDSPRHTQLPSASHSSGTLPTASSTSHGTIGVAVATPTIPVRIFASSQASTVTALINARASEKSSDSSHSRRQSSRRYGCTARALFRAVIQPMPSGPGRSFAHLDGEHGVVRASVKYSTPPKCKVIFFLLDRVPLPLASTDLHDPR